MKVAVFPGSFDPITLGHQNIVERALPLFDKVIVAIGTNSTKQYLFDLEKRKAMIEATFGHLDNVSVETYKGLTIDFCQSKGANYIIRGIRNVADYNYENGIAQMNKAMNEDIETLFMTTLPAYSAINSTIVRDILVNGGNVEQFIPKAVSQLIK